MLAVSLSWIALYTFTPAASRPYVDGSVNNSALAMVFGYNGLERFAVLVPGAISSGPGVMVQVTNGNWAGTAYELVSGAFGAQVGWLYPLSLLALVAGLVAWRRAGRADPVRAGWIMWGVWLATFVVVFGEMGVVLHTAYVASLAPPVAALSGAGIVMFWRWYRGGEWRGVLLPLAVVAELAWAVRLWQYFPGFLPWARWALLVAGAFAVIALAVGWPPQHAPRARREAVGWPRRPARRIQPETLGGSARAGTRGEAGAGLRIQSRLAAAGLAAGVAVMLAAPVTWGLSVLDPVYAGSSFNASAGPGGMSPILSGPFSTKPTFTSAERRVFTYVRAHRKAARYLMAVQSWFQASSYILATGQEVLPVGGFTGQAPEPTLAHIQELVSSGQLRFFQLADGTRSAATSGPEAYKITNWVRRTCRMIPAKDYGGASAANATAGRRSRLVVAARVDGGPGTLYECGTGS
jgi:hypothetical protein